MSKIKWKKCIVSMLENIPGCDEANENDDNEWMNNDDYDEITDEDIVKMVTHEETLEEDLPESQVNRIPHSEGFKMLDGAL